jgi:filamentous hemagglutinin
LIFNEAENTSDGIATAGSAVDMTTAAQLRTKLAFQEAGFLDANGKLTPQAIENSRHIDLTDGAIKNPAIVKILTSDGSNIGEWKKYTTPAVTMPNGQRLQVHFYQNKMTGKIDYVTPDYKVKGIVKP